MANRTYCSIINAILTFPREIVKEEGCGEDERVELSVAKVKKSFFGVLKGMGKFTKEDELTMGK